MNKLLLTILIIIPFKFFGQLLYYPINEANKDKKHTLYFVDNNETLWKIKLKSNVVNVLKDIPYNEIISFTQIEKRVTPKEFLLTDNYMYFPTDKSLLVLDRNGKIALHLIEERVQLFDSTEFGEYLITTPGGKCSGNPENGYFMEFCGVYLFYVTGKKVICMNPSDFEIIQEFNFADFKNRAVFPDYKYIFEAVEFTFEIKGRNYVN
jgi:hypothetical protein